MPFDDYLQLLDWTGRQMAAGKTGAIPHHIEPILVRLEIRPHQWQRASQHFGSLFFGAAGKASNLAKAAAETGRKWFKGKHSCAAIFLDGPKKQGPTTTSGSHPTSKQAA